MSNKARIRIGNQTAFCAAHFMQPFDYAIENGFEAFEWFPDKKSCGAGWDENDLDKPTRLHIRERARAHNVRLSVHARWQVNPLQAEAWPLLLRDVELASDLGAVLLNIHLHTEEGIQRYIHAITPLIRLLADRQIQLAIENTPVTGPEDFNQLFAGLRSLNSVPTDSAGMCLDLGHANLYGWTRHDFLKYLDQLSPQVPIIHLHVHENYGDHDSHLPLFTGPAGQDCSGVIGLLQRLHQRHYSGSFILEQWPHPVSLLKQARDKLVACSTVPEEAPEGDPG